MEAYSIKQLTLGNDHIRSKTEYTRTKVGILNEIREEEEWVSTENRSVSMTPKPVEPIKKAYMKKFNPTLQSTNLELSSDPLVAENQKFLNSIRKNLQIYQLFIALSVSSGLLTQVPLKVKNYYYKFIHTSNASKLKPIKRTPEKFNDIANQTFTSFTESSETYEDPSAYDRNLVAKMLYVHRNKAKTPIHKEKKPAYTFKRKKLLVQKRSVLNRSKSKLINIFQSMCGAPNSNIKSCRLTNYLFKVYLQKKFPHEMVEAIARQFDFKSANFEDYCGEMDRFILDSDRHFMLCFNALDFNKDKYICYQDTYTAIEIRKGNIYDSDLVKIKKMFEMKKRGMITFKRSESRAGGRRMSLVSIASELSAIEEESKGQQHIHPDKPEAITIDDFKRIEFKSKPQFLSHFLEYVCSFDIENLKEVSTPVYKSRKQSQEIIVENLDNLVKDEAYSEKADYYDDLEVAMNLFRLGYSLDLLEKFELLRDKQSHNLKVITKVSMVENWPKIFGAKCDYVSERFYKYFAGPKHEDITKARFLNTIYSLHESELNRKMFSFRIYDSKEDGKITPDEIYRMEQALPVGSPIYEECMLIVNEFIASIFGRKLKPVPFIEFGYYNELIGESLFYKEFLKVLNTPSSELPQKINDSWAVNNPV